MQFTIELTRIARRYAEQGGLIPDLQALRLDEWVARNDVVELAGNGETVAFIVRERRVRVTREGTKSLVFLLDYPARPSR